LSKNVLVLKHFESPKEAGTYYRLVCLTGTNKGEAYILLGNRIVIGRSEKADIRINDNKASREHAEIVKVEGKWVVTDLGSQNGIVVNDKKVVQAHLKETDKLIVGQSVFKFVKIEVGQTKVIKEEKTEASSNKPSLPIIVLGSLLVIFLIMSGSENNDESTRRQAKENNSYQDVSNDYMNAIRKRQANEDKVLKEKLNVIYQRGLREYREGNYFRAIHEFNLALIIAPGDSQAEYYLRKTKEDLDSAIENYLATADRDENSLKYNSAIVSYCAIIRLLYTVPDDPRHKNAIKQINELESKLGMEQGETYCIKKQQPNQ